MIPSFFLLLFSFTAPAASLISTACHTTMVNTDSPCTIHQLNCTDTQIISITNAVYGYKSSCQDNNGVLNCRRVGCCNEETGDCFLPFSDDHKLNLTKTCSNRSTCTYSGVRSFDECEQLDVNAYSKIEYTCNERASLISTACHTTMVNTDSPCTIHQLNCTDTQIISITNAVYGYKSSCQDNNGVLNCRRVGCCNEETGDCFLPFSDDHKLNLTKTCSNRSTCTYSGVRSFDECEQLDVNAYSKIEYTCNERETSTEKITVTRTTEGSTDKTEAKATENPDTAQGTAPTKEITATENLDTAQGTAPTKDNHSSNTDQTDLWIIIASVIGGVILVSVIVLLSFWIRKKRVQKAGMKNHKSSTYRSNPEESPNLDRTSYVRTYDLINSVENQPALSNKQDNHPEDNNDYDHIGSNKMPNDKPKDDEYDHIRRDYSTGNGDNVNKITNDKPKRRDEYDHIRRDYSPGNDGDVRDVSYESNDDYNILGGHNSHDNPPPTDNTYNHIGEFSANKMDDNDYYNVDKVVKNKSEQ